LKEIERHAGVLGLAALVLMAPYDIPSWLPETLGKFIPCLSFSILLLPLLLLTTCLFFHSDFDETF
jgi:hypothetical protein